VVFDSVSVEILDYIGDGNAKVFIERYIMIVGCTDGDGVITIIGFVVERSIILQASIGI